MSDGNHVNERIDWMIKLQLQSAKEQAAQGEVIHEMRGDVGVMKNEMRRLVGRVASVEARCDERGPLCQERFNTLAAAVSQTREESGRWAVAEIRRGERERLIWESAKRIAKALGALAVLLGGAGGMWAILNAACGHGI